MTKESTKESPNKSCTPLIIKYIIATATIVSLILFGIFNLLIEQKNTIIDSQDRDIAKYKEQITSYQKKVGIDSLLILELQDSMRNIELTIDKTRQRKIIGDTTLCPKEAIHIFEGQVLIRYVFYYSGHPEVSIESRGSLSVTNGYFHLSDPSQETFNINKKEYIFNFLGFDQSKGEGCIRFSIYKK